MISCLLCESVTKHSLKNNPPFIAKLEGNFIMMGSLLHTYFVRKRLALIYTLISLILLFILYSRQLSLLIKCVYYIYVFPNVLLKLNVEQNRGNFIMVEDYKTFISCLKTFWSLFKSGLYRKNSHSSFLCDGRLNSFFIVWALVWFHSYNFLSWQIFKVFKI